MSKYIARRLLQFIPALLGVTFVAFMLLHLRGDPADLILPLDIPAEQKEVFRKAYGLDRPLYVQYGQFLWQAAQGKFGESIYRGDYAGYLILARLPYSARLAVLAVLGSIVVGIPLGIIAALRQNTWVDYTIQALAGANQAIASFWLALMLILIFGVYLHALPVAGAGSWKHLILPAIAVGHSSAALKMRLVRSSMLEVLRQDYVRTARAKGLKDHIVIIRHALRNALIPVVTVIGINFSALLGGAVIIEIIFSYPGVGSLVYDAVNNRDYPIVLAGTTMLASIFLVVLLAVDILYAFIDPRIRYQ